MFSLVDSELIEGEAEGTEEEDYAAIQRAINSGAWNFPGSYGRAMMTAIEGGICLLGHSAHADAYGNTVPGRGDVQPGTKGSLDFVTERRGPEWAERMAAIE
ncbi:MAG: hypothetical protein ACKN9W_03840 [Methylococcus sp.]